MSIPRVRIGFGCQPKQLLKVCARSIRLKIAGTSRLRRNEIHHLCPLWVISGHFASQTKCPLYPPESGHLQCTSACPLWANSGHEPLHSINSSSSFRNSQRFNDHFALRMASLIHPTSQREEQHHADNHCAAQHRDYGALVVGQSMTVADANPMDYV